MIKATLLQLVLGITMGLVCFSHSMAAGRVLIVHSFHAESQWVKEIDAAIEKNFTSSDIGYRFFYMDAKRNSDFAWKLKSAQRARQLVDVYTPQVIIAIDDVAQAYLARNYVGNSPIQIVFAGVNADPDFYGYPAENAVGILERTYVDQVFDLLKRIMPISKQVAWISDDSVTANLVLSRVRQQSENGQLPLPIIDYLQPITLDQWKSAILKYDADPGIGALLIPLYHTVKARIDGQSLLPADVMKWTIENTHKPIIGLWPFSTDDGALCAVVVNPKEHGHVAALMAKQLLSGKRAGELPVIVNQDGYVIINLATAARLNIHVPFEIMLSSDKIIE